MELFYAPSLRRRIGTREAVQKKSQAVQLCRSISINIEKCLNDVLLVLLVLGSILYAHLVSTRLWLPSYVIS